MIHQHQDLHHVILVLQDIHVIHLVFHFLKLAAVEDILFKVMVLVFHVQLDFHVQIQQEYLLLALLVIIV